jgi:hypothetical protein
LLSVQYAEKDLPPDSKELEILKSMLKTMEDELATWSGNFEGERSRGRHAKLEGQFYSALRNNLVGKALEILTDKDTNFEKEFARNIREIIMTRIALEMATGRLEDVAADLDSDAAGRIRTSETTPDDQSFQGQILLIDFRKMMFEGNYDGAAELYERLLAKEMGKRVFGPDPPPTNAESSFKSSLKSPEAFQTLGLNRLEEIALLMPVPPLLSIPIPKSNMWSAHQLQMMTATLPYRLRQQELTRIRQNNSELYDKLGVIFLLDGDISRAKKSFEQTRQKGEPEWGVEPVTNSQAERYIRLIEEGQKTRRK